MELWLRWDGYDYGTKKGCVHVTCGKSLVLRKWNTLLYLQYENI